VVGVAPGDAGPPGDPAGLALGLAVVVLAALAPDLDSAGSAAARSLGPLSRLPARAVQLLLHHRGPLHSALAVLAAGVLGGLLGARLGLAGVGAAVAFGWGTHVLADAVTDRGVPLLWPLWRRRVRLPFGLGPATGGPGEAVLVVSGLLGCVVWGALGLAA
jgi:inner membrane protein